LSILGRAGNAYVSLADWWRVSRVGAERDSQGARVRSAATIPTAVATAAASAIAQMAFAPPPPPAPLSPPPWRSSAASFPRPIRAPIPAAYGSGQNATQLFQSPVPSAPPPAPLPPSLPPLPEPQPKLSGDGCGDVEFHRLFADDQGWPRFVPLRHPFHRLRLLQVPAQWAAPQPPLRCTMPVREPPPPPNLRQWPW